jgi:hypothetical protein
VNSDRKAAPQPSTVDRTWPKWTRVVGVERRTLANDLVQRYAEGASIRTLATSTGRSYGFVHQILTEAGVELRKRGGPRRRRRPTGTPTGDPA